MSDKNDSKKKEESSSFKLSRTAFSSLFYPLPTKYTAGSKQATFLARDQRHDSKKDALESDFFLQQMNLIGRLYPINNGFDHSPTVEYIDGAFCNRNGIWKGIYLHDCVRISDIQIGRKIFKLNMMIQFVWAFPTKREATDYHRNRVKNGTIGEEKAPMNNADYSLEVSRKIKKRSIELGVKELDQLFVITSTRNEYVSIMASVGNVVTKIYLSLFGSSQMDGVEIAARVLVYLDDRLLANRVVKLDTDSDSNLSSSTIVMNKEAFHTPNMNVCAYWSVSDY
jgi:hypothetical protein